MSIDDKQNLLKNQVGGWENVAQFVWGIQFDGLQLLNELKITKD